MIIKIFRLKTNRIKRVFFYVLIILCIVPSVSFSLSFEEIQRKVNELNQKLQEYEARKKELNEKILEKKYQTKTLQNEIDYLSYNINKLENDIEILGLNIEQKTLEIEQKNIFIEDTNKKIKTTISQIEKILNQLNEFKRPIIYFIFTSISISEFTNKIDQFSKINNALILNAQYLKTLKDNLRNEKKELEFIKSDLTDLRLEKEAKKVALFLQKQQQATILQQTKGEEKKYQSLLSGVEKERIRIMNEIVRYEEEAKRLRNFKFYSATRVRPPEGTKLFRFPVDGAILTQRYGSTEFSRKGYYGGAIHNGIDIASDFGSKVYAAAEGKVVGKNIVACPNFRDYGCQGGWGNWVAIEHPNKMVTLYAHLMQPSLLDIGQTVTVDSLLGYQGSSGNSTATHLHFSVYTEFFITDKGWPGYNTEGTVNPMWYL